MYVTSWGTWTAQGENAWHVETMELQYYGGYQDDYRFNLDVSFDEASAYINVVTQAVEDFAVFNSRFGLSCFW